MLVSEKSRFLLLMLLAAYTFHELRVVASLCALFVMPFLVLGKDGLVFFGLSLF